MTPTPDPREEIRGMLEHGWLCHDCHGLGAYPDAQGEFVECAPCKRRADALRAVLAQLNAAEERNRDWQFVPDDNGGHMLSVPTGDKWYPESFLRARLAAVEEERDQLREERDSLAETLQWRQP